MSLVWPPGDRPDAEPRPCPSNSQQRHCEGPCRDALRSRAARTRHARIRQEPHLATEPRHGVHHQAVPAAAPHRRTLARRPLPPPPPARVFPRRPRRPPPALPARRPRRPRPPRERAPAQGAPRPCCGNPLSPCSQYPLSDKTLKPASMPLYYTRLVDGYEKSAQGIARPWWKIFFGIW